MLDAPATDLIRLSWAQAAAAPEIAAGLFYGRLFAVAPRTRPLFRNDMAAQGAKLVATLGFVVDHLDRPEALREAAAALAVRHVAYGVAAADYDAVGEALIWTLAQALGPRFDAPTRRAWERAYADLSALMIAAAYGPPEAETYPKA